MKMIVSKPESFSVESAAIESGGCKSFAEFLKSNPELSMEVRNERAGIRNSNRENGSTEEN